MIEYAWEFQSNALWDTFLAYLIENITQNIYEVEFTVMSRTR